MSNQYSSQARVGNSRRFRIFGGNKNEPKSEIIARQTVASRALTYVIVIMSLLASLSLGVVTVVWTAAENWSSNIQKEVTIQIRPTDNADMLEEIEKAIEIAESFPGVESAHAISDQDTNALLEPWLGTGFDFSVLPVPRIITVVIEDDINLNSLDDLRNQISESVSGGSLDNHSVWSSRLAITANTLVVFGIGILILVLTSMALCIVFGTRSAMFGNRDVVSVLHFVGADDKFIAREFQRHFLRLGLRGGLIGGLAAIVIFFSMDLVANFFVSNASQDPFNTLLGGTSLSWVGYFGIVLIIAVVTTLTTLTSRIAVHSHLYRMDL